ncbi:uncharacterized protein LOC131878995 isoform X1 [Tigriopus californicus]|uniref:uncharacterized protein LOC131878995 isoform X1 n=1 Tax=Tigriopus californicus TaxID=6832 RepID=UPI0027DAA889|nr:uncharacterized protein LOC131878995 isoform X1 [Tigriopus californicus]
MAMASFLTTIQLSSVIVTQLVTSANMKNSTCDTDAGCIQPYYYNNHNNHSSFMHCVNGRCEEEEEERHCQNSGDCSEGQACIKGNCIQIPLGSVKFCTSNRTCPPDFVCHIARNLCVKELCLSGRDCPGDMWCIRRKCRGQPCTDDRLCPPNQICEANHCSPLQTKANSTVCTSHGECPKRSRMCSNRTKTCTRLMCSQDSDCSQGQSCHQDRWSGYCSDFTCTTSHDCFPRNCQEISPQSEICASLETCRDGKCQLSPPCWYNSDCPQDHVCLKNVCAQVMCKEPNQCPKNSKCNPESGFCKSMDCVRHEDCLANQKCQHRICVVHKDGQCDLHLDCPIKQICHEGRCISKSCQHDQDCADNRLVCHPDKFCTAHEDFVTGMHMEKARQISVVSDILESPLAVKPSMPIDDHTLQKLIGIELVGFSGFECLVGTKMYTCSLDTTTSKTEKNFPSLEALLHEAWETTLRDEEIGLEEGCHFQNTCPKSRSARSKRQSLYDYSNETFLESAPLNAYGDQPTSGVIRIGATIDIPANAGVQRRPLERNLQGDPAFKAASLYSDILLSTTEKLAHKLGLNPIQAAVGLGRQRANCIWKQPAQLRSAELPRACTEQGFRQIGVNGVNPRIYRSHSGACNNLHPRRKHFGLLSLPFDRLIRGDYHDGISKFRRSRFDGSPLPNPRSISLGVTKVVRRSSRNRGRNLPDPNVNTFFVFFGQFLAHDFSNTLVRSITNSTPVFGAAHTARGSGAATSCCGPLPLNFDVTNVNNTANTFIEGNAASRSFCIPFRIPPNDPYWSRKAPNKRWQCMAQITTGSVPPFSCKLGPRQIMTQISHWLDLSQIYNSKKSYFDALNAQLNTPFLRTSGNNYMPLCFTTVPPPGTPVNSCPACLQSARRNGLVSRGNCFIGGDFRTNENLGLAAIQTIFVRFHNFVANKLPTAWPSRIRLEEARRICVAMYQHIVYNEYLPLLIGQRMMRKYKLFSRRRGYSRQYNRNMDVGVMNVFATASFRFGHAMIPDQVQVLDENLSNITSLNAHNLVFDWFRFRVNRFEEDLLRGMIATPAGRVDGFFSRAAREIFNFDGPSIPFPSNNGGNDLLAWNINRGRDHGLGAFHQYVKLARGEDITGWDWFAKNLIYGRAMTTMLKQLYKSYKDTDTYILGLLEKPPARGGRRLHVLGPTHASLVGSQFARFRRADRFFYEEGTSRLTRFSPRELAQIKRITMARLLCDSSVGKSGPTNLKYPLRVFRRVTPQNPFVQCTSIPQIDWTVFKQSLMARAKAFGRKK